MSQATEKTGERKTVIITGANRGIGYAAARALVTRGCRVVMLSRDEERGRRALDGLAGAGPGAAELVVGDLASVQKTRAAAAAILAACPRIDVMIHNAGRWPDRLERNEDGLESAFAVNHLAPFLLNHLLEERFVAGGTRVVQVTAGLYVKGRPDLERSPTGEDFHPLWTYPTTKLYNLMCVPLFASRWNSKGVTIHAVHPGVIRTGLGDRGGVLGVVLRAVKRLWMTPEQGARPVSRLALDPTIAGMTGRYFHLEEEAPLRPIATDGALAERLWQQARHLSGLND